jgi:hemerythrin-like domain-containing protein
MEPVIAWHEEHVYFHQLLQVLRRQLDRFHDGEPLDYELVQDIVSYLHEYADRFHHPREDVAFACLARRCPDLKLTLTRLAQEHRIIACAGGALQRLVRSILGGALIPRAEIEVAAATYLAYYDKHIATEEEDVLPRAAKELSPEDWEDVRNAVQPGPDPLFGDNPQERYRALRRQIAQQI